MLEEEKVTDQTLYDTLMQLYSNRAQYIEAMEKSQVADAIGTITGLIEDAAGKN